jgi:DUF1009 family protein
MPAAEKGLNSTPPANVKQLGIIAGGGALPDKVLHACDRKGITPFIVAFEGQTDPLLVKNRNHMWARLGAAGSVLETLRAHEIADLVLIGSMRRPSLAELRPDLKTAEFFIRIGLRALGDNDFLKIVREALEEEGFRIHGAHKFADDLLAPKGTIGKYKPGKEDWVGIHRGLQVSRELGGADVGQAVIVQEGLVLGVEAAEGTDELIRRCKHLRRKGRAGVLVKTCKPQQDRDLDLPTIGPETVINAAASGLGGIAVHAGHSLVIDQQKVAEIADKHKIFVIGIDPAEELNKV